MSADVAIILGIKPFCIEGAFFEEILLHKHLPPGITGAAHILKLLA